MRGLRRFVIAACCVAVLGCGGPADNVKRVPVNGKLTLNGAPLEGADVSFVPVDKTAGAGGIGRTGPDGTFTLKDPRVSTPGVAPGHYKVVVSRWVTPDGKPIPPETKSADVPGARDSLPPKLSSIGETPLTATVPEGGGSVTVDIPARIP